MKDNRVYKKKRGTLITRDTYGVDVGAYPAIVGIRKFHGCVEYGAAWDEKTPTGWLCPSKKKYIECLSYDECRKQFGFYPRKGTAWHIDGKKRTKIDIEFTD